MNRIVINNSKNPNDWRVFPNSLSACRWALNSVDSYSSLELYYFDDKDDTKTPGTLIGQFSVDGILHVHDLERDKSQTVYSSGAVLSTGEQLPFWYLMISLTHVLTCGYFFLVFLGSISRGLNKYIDKVIHSE